MTIFGCPEKNVPALLRFRPHRSTTAAYCYRPRSVACLSVCRSVRHISEPCKTAEPIDAVWVADSGRPIESGEGVSHCKV